MRYMLLIYGPDGPADPAVSQMDDYAPWIAYTQWLQDKGIYLGGEPLEPTSTATTVRVRDGRTSVTDGPFAETKEALGGYYIIECDDLDTALEAAARCPGALVGSMEVRPLGTMPGGGGPGGPA